MNMVYAVTTGGDHVDLFLADRVAAPPDLAPALHAEAPPPPRVPPPPPRPRPAPVSPEVGQ